MKMLKKFLIAFIISVIIGILHLYFDVSWILKIISCAMLIICIITMFLFAFLEHYLKKHHEIVDNFRRQNQQKQETEKLMEELNKRFE